jgi:hypothetical protein
MKSIPDRNLIRQYLLGRLDESRELENELSESILFNDDVSEMADSIEDEIIEEYLEGTLGSADKIAVDEYFLRPAQRREKLRFIKLLQHHFETTQDSLAQPRPEVHALRDRFTKDSAERSPGHYWHSPFRTYAQLAALVLLCVVSVSYVYSLRNRQTRLESDLAQERGQSVDLATQVSQLQPPMIALTLVADRSRDAAAQIPRLEVKPSTQRIVVEIALAKVETVAYDVRLESKSAKTPLWKARLLPIVSPAGDARLVFDVPAQGMESDIYSFAVSSLPPATERQKYYDFEVKITK